ncbi:MAG TPA: hypothetical protein EYQ62_05465, partial [Verrucomicrobiales bacterium]|nr:hypothetical protein [Verrucomicrobiales bacterium]
WLVIVIIVPGLFSAAVDTIYPAASKVEFVHETREAAREAALKKKKEMDERMAIYAVMVDSMDQSIGRILSALDERGLRESTLVFFLADNGGCDEGGRFGFERKKGGQLGTDSSFASYGLGWANASNTPFQFFKKDNHEGGIASPLIVHWPHGIAARGEWRQQPGHVIDIMATCLEVAGAKYPGKFKKHTIVPLEGKSLVPTFADCAIDREALYWEHVGNRAVRSGDWKLVANKRFRKQDWELYNLKIDRTETVNLIDQREDKAQELEAMWQA